jgi:hypothetical protein
LNDSLRKSFGVAAEDLADLWNEFQSGFEFGEYDAIQERPNHNEENADDRKAPQQASHNKFLSTTHAA